ncbi:MAG: response regulator transcription factor [Chloroflexota bacterium]|nr:response regulator transcription factor [Chloroflexota bacterium]
MLAGEAGLELVGEAANGREALELCDRVHPDLALLDMNMPEMDGLATTRAIKQLSPAISVLIVTMQENPEYMFEAVKAGAAGYVLKDVSRFDLLSAIRRVMRGESCLPEEMTAQLLQRLAHQAATPAAPRSERLTPREQEVLRLLAQGKTNREIAAVLVLSPGTVKIHVERIIAKLGVSDRTQAAVRAVTLGLVEPATL